MRYLCSQCGHKSESSVALSDAQLLAFGCPGCGAVGTLKARTESDARWWLGIKGERHGPYSLAQLGAMAGEGRITPNSYIWGPSFTAWERAGRIPDLAPAFALPAVPPPPPVPPAVPPSRTVARPVTRAGMFAASAGDREVSVSGPMPLPVQDSIITQLAPRTAGVPAVRPLTPGPAASPVAAPVTGGVRLDDARKPPPTVFGMPLVQPLAPPVTPAASVGGAPTIPVAAAPSVPVSVTTKPVVAAPVSMPPAVPPVLAPAQPPFPTPVHVAPSPVGTGPALPVATTPASPASQPTVPSNPVSPPAREASTVAPAPSQSAPAALDDDFFATPPSPAAVDPNDIFASMDAAATQGPDLSALLRDAPAPMRSRAPTKAEMQALRQEFSVVARLEKHNRKRWMYVGAAAVFIAGVVIAILVLAPEKQMEYKGLASAGAGDGDVERPLYEIPTTPQSDNKGDEAATVATNTPAEPTNTAAGGAKKDVAKGAGTGKPKTGTVATEKVGTAAISAERFAELTRDEVGKTEMKLDFDSSEAARKASAEAEAKKSAIAGDLAAEVVGVFAKKKSQFARCSDNREEKLRILFTVATNGKVSGVQVEGAANDAKRTCVKDILDRSVFPAGPEAQTYSQVLTL